MDYSKIAERTLHFLTANNNQSVTTFLNEVTKFITLELEVDYAFVSYVNGESPFDANVVSIASKGELIDNFSYALKDTPCENVFDKEYCEYSPNVVEEFPKDQILVDLDISSYAGSPFV